MQGFHCSCISGEKSDRIRPQVGFEGWFVFRCLKRLELGMVDIRDRGCSVMAECMQIHFLASVGGARKDFYLKLGRAAASCCRLFWCNLIKTYGPRVWLSRWQLCVYVHIAAIAEAAIVSPQLWLHFHSGSYIKEVDIGKESQFLFRDSFANGHNYMTFFFLTGLMHKTLGFPLSIPVDHL